MGNVIFGSIRFGRLFGLIFVVGWCFLVVGYYWFGFGCAHLI